MSVPTKTDNRPLMKTATLSRSFDRDERTLMMDQYHARDFRDLGNGCYHKQPRRYE